MPSTTPWPAPPHDVHLTVTAPPTPATRVAPPKSPTLRLASSWKGSYRTNRYLFARHTTRCTRALLARVWVLRRLPVGRTVRSQTHRDSCVRRGRPLDERNTGITETRCIPD